MALIVDEECYQICIAIYDWNRNYNYFKSSFQNCKPLVFEIESFCM